MAKWARVDAVNGYVHETTEMDPAEWCNPEIIWESVDESVEAGMVKKNGEFVPLEPTPDPEPTLSVPAPAEPAPVNQEPVLGPAWNALGIHNV